MSVTPAIPVRLSGVAHLDDDKWAAAAQYDARRLADALGLPAMPVVALDPLLAPADTEGPPYSLRIGDRQARLAWVSPTRGKESTLDDLVLRLSHDLARNAELFVTAEVADAVRAMWREHAPRHAAVELPESDLVPLLAGCVRAGRRVDADLLMETAPDARDPLWWGLLEEALDADPSLRITMPFPADATGDSLMDHVYERTGVILPQVDLRVGDESSPNWIVELGDIVLRVPAPDPLGEFLDQATTVLRPWLPAFVTLQTTRLRLESAAAELPRLVSAVRARFSDVYITRSLRALVEERIAVNDLRSVLGGLLEIREATSADEENRIVFHSPAGTPPPQLALRDGRLDPEDAADCVRRWTRRAVTLSHWDAGTLRTRLITPSLEATFRAGAMVPGSNDHRDFLTLARASTEPILTNLDIRRRVFEAIALELPHISVLCYQELLPETNVIPTDRLAL